MDIFRKLGYAWSLMSLSVGNGAIDGDEIKRTKHHHHMLEYGFIRVYYL